MNTGVGLELNITGPTLGKIVRDDVPAPEGRPLPSLSVHDGMDHCHHLTSARRAPKAAKELFVLLHLWCDDIFMPFKGLANDRGWKGLEDHRTLTSVWQPR